MDDPVTQWIQQATDGDGEAARRLWERYFERLVRLARARLQSFKRRAADEEDVSLSAFESFYEGLEAGRFPAINDRDELWRLLVTITSRKARAYIRRETRRKRGGGRIRGESVFDPPPGGDATPGLDEAPGPEPTPDFAVQAAEQFELLLTVLNDEHLRRIAMLKLEGYTNEQIAESQETSLRTVKRRLARIRELWQRHLDADGEGHTPST